MPATNFDHGSRITDYGPNPIAQFNAAFGYHFAEHIWYDAATLRLMAEFATNRGRPALSAALECLREAGGQT